MMQRDIKAILVAHKIDPKRRELYVEGCRDRSFFLWFLGDERDPDTSIFVIDSVKCDIPVEGGCRGRLLTFAASIRPHNLQVRCFADADFDRILNRPVPPNVWLTDRRDLEGYFLQPDCINKVLHLALATEKITPQAILGELFRLGRPLGVLRLFSEQEKLKLPFNDRPCSSYLKTRNGRTELKFDSYLQALLQGVGISLKRIGEFKLKLEFLNERTKKIPDLELIHGKDSISILQAILCCDGFTKDAVESSFWTSLEHSFIGGFPNFMTALSYLRRRRC